MKTIITSIVVCLVLNLSTYGQDYPGYFIDKEGEKNEVVFKIEPVLFGKEPNFETILTKIHYTINEQKGKLTPDMCKSFCLFLNNEDVVFLSLPNLIGGNLIAPNGIFLRPRITGPAALYYYYYSNNSTSMSLAPNGSMRMQGSGPFGKTKQGWIIAKDDGKTLKITYGGARRKDLANFFQDYTTMAEMILNKETSGTVIQDTERLVNEYNTWRLSQN